MFLQPESCTYQFTMNARYNPFIWTQQNHRFRHAKQKFDKTLRILAVKACLIFLFEERTAHDSELDEDTA